MQIKRRRSALIVGSLSHSPSKLCALNTGCLAFNKIGCTTIFMFQTGVLKQSTTFPDHSYPCLKFTIKLERMFSDFFLLAHMMQCCIFTQFGLHANTGKETWLDRYI